MPAGATSLRAIADLAATEPSVERLWNEALRRVCLDLDADAGVAMALVGSERMHVAATFCWPTPLDQAPIPIAPDSQAAFVLATDGTVLADLTTERRFVPSRLVANAGFQTSLSARVAVGSTTHGLMGLQYRDQRLVETSAEAHLWDVCSILGLGLTHCQLAEQATHQIDHDALTGLLNRRGTFELLDDLVRRRHPGCLMLIDLDGFKLVNDRHGHGVGDHVLQIVGDRLRAAVRPTDTVARLSGDEFVVVLNHMDLGRGLDVAERLIGHLEQSIAIPHATITISASVGVAVIAQHDSVLTLINAADVAMYSAKAAGRGSAKAAAGSTAEWPANETSHDVELNGAQFDLADIDAAIEHLSVVFQPIVDARTLAVTGVEALTRGPTGPLENPAALFRIAETWGRLPQLELAAKRLTFATPIPEGIALYINIDPGALTTPGFLDQLLDAWRTSPNHGRPLIIELTERHLRSQPGRLLKVVEQCRHAGWEVALDDLGARAESLTALALVTPDVVKLDIGLINTHNASHLAATTVALASYCEGRHVQIVAEGIERDDQTVVALQLGATHLQGYLFGRPAADIAPITIDPGRLITDATGVPDRRPSTSFRRVHRSTLLAISRHIESLATHIDSILLSSIQHVDRYSVATRAQYAALARRCGTVGIVGVGVPAGQRHGVHHGPVAAADELARCWEVLLLQPEGAIALLAEQADEGSDQWFDYVITTDRTIIEPRARRLMLQL